ncbi:MAG: MMPL family transporter [Verrucomicrobia bacterium]|nr:MMPL family transporter [Verrucomicrobiota bacterium]
MLRERIVEGVLERPRQLVVVSAVLTVIVMILSVLPRILSGGFLGLPAVKVDTDPENMLASEEPVRVLHDAKREEFSLYDMVVVGVVNETHVNGVFNAATLKDVYDLTEYAREIRIPGVGGDKPEGVVGMEVIAPSTVDNIEQGGLGSVRFEWLMDGPPAGDESAKEVAEKAGRIPFLQNTLVSDDQKSLALYIPITSKKVSYRVAELLREKIATFSGKDRYYITGLPVAQDQFGVEMFRQMAVSAPVAMLLIFGLLWIFFRRIQLIVSPMIVAVISVIWTMGLLVITGNTVHIMSSMIPIFIMPIAVLDAVHILSDFFDVYPKLRDRKKALLHVMRELWKPMLFTSLTTCAGFASLAFTPIPPVQVFGVFIGLGVVFAWLLTVTIIPAWIMILPDKALENFGFEHKESTSLWSLSGILHRLGHATYHHAKLILMVSLVVCGIAAYGMTKIQINDNPVKWFEPEHEIRQADRELNKRFAGTYMAYLSLEAPEVTEHPELTQQMVDQASEQIRGELRLHAGKPLSDVLSIVQTIQDQETDDDRWDAWEESALMMESAVQSLETFKQPGTLRWMEQLQAYLLETGLVGKSNSLSDIVKTVYRELMLGDMEAFRVPDSSEAVAQTLITYQGSHRPGDLWHFVSPDFRHSNIWIQLKSGDNKDMQALVTAVDRFCAATPPPAGIEQNWFGLTYINVVWQKKMVAGMMQAFAGSFIIVLIMMVVLFRSISWGLLSMVPLTMTIALIYGFIGIIGKDYDMPVAVLSSLSLGLAVDYAIHFLARSREIYSRQGNWKSSVSHIFGEPGRAISRNVIVIGIGFLPLLLAPLVPYQTVGFLFPPSY